MEKCILIIKTGALGDVLRTTTILPGLRKKYPNYRIQWYTSRDAKELLVDNPLVDNILTVREEIENSYKLVLSLDEEKEFAEIASKVSKDKLVGTFIQDGNVRYTPDSALWFGMGLLRPDEEGGIENANLLKKQNQKTQHEIMAEIAGIDYKNEKPVLNLNEIELDYGRQYAKKNNLKEEDFIVGLNTGSGKRWPNKKWSDENTVKLADMLIEKNSAKIIILGGKEEKGRFEKLDHMTKNQLFDSGTQNTIRQFASIINQCDVIVTTDTLAMHLSIALNKKTVALIGPTSSSEINLFNLGEKITPPKVCKCFYKRVCKTVIPCMDTITVGNVYDAILRSMNG